VLLHGQHRLDSSRQTLRFTGAVVSFRLLDGLGGAADSGSSPRDTLAKRKIVLRELKETRFRLRVLRQTGYLTAAQDPVIEENTELMKIVAKLVRNAEEPPK